MPTKVDKSFGKNGKRPSWDSLEQVVTT